MFFGCLPCCGGKCEPDYADDSAVSWSVGLDVQLAITGQSAGGSVDYLFDESLSLTIPYSGSIASTVRYPSGVSNFLAGLAGTLNTWGWHLTVRASGSPTSFNLGVQFNEHISQRLQILPAYSVNESRLSRGISGVGFVRISRHLIGGNAGAKVTAVPAESYVTIGGLTAAIQTDAGVEVSLGNLRVGRAFRSYTPDSNDSCNALPIVVQTQRRGFGFVYGGAETHTLDVDTIVSINSITWTDTDGIEHEGLHAPQRPNVAGYPNNIFADSEAIPSYPPPF